MDLSKENKFIKIKNFSCSQLSEYLQSFNKSKIQININHIKGQENPYLSAIEISLGNLIHLQELEIFVKKNCILFETGYISISNAIKKLSNLTKLSIQIDQLCFLEDSGLTALTNAIQTLSELRELELEIGIHNYFSSSSIKQFICSIQGLRNLIKFKLQTLDIPSSLQLENISVWSDLYRLQQLESLELALNFFNFGDQDLLELFDQITQLKNLQSLNIYSHDNDSGSFWIDKFIYSLGQLQKLKILIINFEGKQVKLSNSQINQLYSNISDLKFLEQLDLTTIEDQLIIQDFEQYLKFIGSLKNLTTLTLDCNFNSLSKKMNQLTIGENLKQLSKVKELHLILGDIQFRFYDEFIVELSDAIKNMNDLNSLTLSLISYISEVGYIKLGESFLSLNKLERMKIIFQDHEKEIDRSLILHNIRYLTSLKKLIVLIKETSEYFDCSLLFDSIQYLINLEVLFIKQGKAFQGESNGLTNISILSSSLKKLTNLTNLLLNVQRVNIDNQQSIQQFNEAIGSLKNLEQLKICFFTGYEEQQEFEIVNCLKDLENLKTLEMYIELGDHFQLDSLTNSMTNLKSLETLLINITQTISPLVLMYFIEALEQCQNLKHLDLQINLMINKQIHSHIFGIVCSLIQHLQVLKINNQNQDGSSQDLLLFLFEGIKRLKNLNKLEFICNQGEINDLVIEKLGLALENLQKLRVLKIELLGRSEITQKGERLLSQKINQLKELKILKLQIRCRCEEMIGDQILNISLGLDKLNKICIKQKQQSFQKNNEITDSQINQSVDEELMDMKNNELNEEIQYEFSSSQVTKIKLDFEIEQKKSHFLAKLNNYFSQINNLKYLNSLELSINSTIQNLEPLKLNGLNSFSNLKKLNYLKLDITDVFLEISAIQQIKEGFKDLLNLEFIYLSFKNSFNYDYLLMEGISYLKNLNTLVIDMCLSDKAAVCLQNSLQTYQKLKKCYLQIIENGDFSQEGIMSIENGLYKLQDLAELFLILCNLNISAQSNNLPQLGKFLDNKKKLDRLKFMIEKNNYCNSFGAIEVIKSIGQLENLANLKIVIKENNNINSEHVSEFLESLSYLKNLKEVLILIHQQDNQLLLKSKFAILFNRVSSQEDVIKFVFDKNYIKFKFLDYNITIKSESQDQFQIVDINFFQTLKNTISIYLIVKQDFTSSQSEFFKTLAKFNFTQINIRFDSILNKTAYQQFCNVIYSWQNAYVLKIYFELQAFIEQNNNQLDLISESICELKSLFTLKLAAFNSKPELKEYLSAINCLSKLQQLNEVSINSTNESINKEILPIIKKKLNKLVNLDDKVEIDYYW